MSQPPSGGEEPNASGRGNLFALIAVVVLVGLGYWAFNYSGSTAQTSELPGFWPA